MTTLDLRLLRYEVRTPLLASGRVRVALVTDLHATDALPFDHYRRALDAVRAGEPDLVLLAGDHASEGRHAGLLARILEGLPAAPLGTFAVLGNHDYWAGPEPARQALRAAGVRILAGESARIPMSGGQGLRVCGSEHPWGPDLDPAALGPEGDFVLVLTHSPDNVYRLARPGVAAVFAGHYHAGQYRVPGLGPLVVPSVYGRRFDSGHFRVNGVHLFVPAGVGSSMPPVRLWCPPEVAIVDFGT
jgi:predicted MPP superfamily phosphohydrolase